MLKTSVKPVMAMILTLFLGGCFGPSRPSLPSTGGRVDVVDGVEVPATTGDLGQDLENTRKALAEARRMQTEYAARAAGLEQTLKDQEEELERERVQARKAWLSAIAIWSFGLSLLGLAASIFLFFWMGSTLGKLAFAGIATFGSMMALSVAFIFIQPSLGWITLCIVGALVIGGIGYVLWRLYKTEIVAKVNAELADKIEEASDNETVQAIKREISELQDRLKIRKLTDKVRGK